MRDKIVIGEFVPDKSLSPLRTSRLVYGPFVVGTISEYEKGSPFVMDQSKLFHVGVQTNDRRISNQWFSSKEEALEFVKSL